MMQKPKSLFFFIKKLIFLCFTSLFVKNYLEFIIFRERNNNHNKINAHKVAKIDIKAMKLSSEKRFEKSK